MKPTNYPEAEGCTWCGRRATFRLSYQLPNQTRWGRGRAFACELHIAEARRSLCIVRVEMRHSDAVLP